MEQIQFISTTPKDLVNLLNESVKSQLEDFKKDFSNQNPDELLTREQTASYLQIDLSTLHNWTTKGKIKCLAIGSRRYFKKSDILESLKPLNK
jgi:excisionase family DNA binding protein